MHGDSWRTHHWGGLDCRTYDQLPRGAEPQLLVTLCHGFGAPGNDLDGLGPTLVQIAPALADHVRFLFPSAPLSLESMGLPGGRAWWPIDTNELAAAVQAGRFRDLRDTRPPELPESRAKLSACVEAALDESGLSADRLVLGGFSQGAMLTTDLALRCETQPAALCVFSGTLINEQQWREHAERARGLRVLQSHGTFDPLLPFEAALWLRDLLTRFGASVEFVEFPGPHTIPAVALHRCAAMLRGLVEA